ncbi:MAG: hypothetical protein RR657_03840 [Peptostreptococcaceae bacterium]
MKDSIVMGTQVSLSRNIDNYPFPHKLSQSESITIINKIKDILLDSKDQCNEDLVLKNIEEISDIEKNTMIERRIISSPFSKNNNGALVCNSDKSIDIIINNEDHINIKVYKEGLNLDEAYDITNKLDDIIGDKLDYAFNDDVGYLTSCPVNAGTGLKVSVIVHLPILSLQDKVEDYHNIAHKIGANIKGINNEKSNTLGSMYEITNQTTYGRSERNIIESVKSLTKDIIVNEIEARKNLKEYSSIETEDEIFRSLGILQNARIISAYEAMKHLSNIKLGLEMDYIKDINSEKINSLMLGTKPALRLLSSSMESDIDRASYMREELTLANRNKK